MSWFIFALIPPFFFSVSVFIDKYLIEKRIKNPIALSALMGLTSGIVGIVIGVITGFRFIGFMNTGLILFGGMLLLFYLVPYFEAMKTDDASRVIPLFGFMPVMTLILSAFFLKEVLTPIQILGLFIVVIAAFSISLEKIEGKIFRPRKSLYFMFLSSLLYGSIGIIFRFIVKGVPYWTTISYEFMGAGLAGLLFLCVPSIRAGIRKDKKGIQSSIGIIGIDKVLGSWVQTWQMHLRLH